VDSDQKKKKLVSWTRGSPTIEPSLLFPPRRRRRFTRCFLQCRRPRRRGPHGRHPRHGEYSGWTRRLSDADKTPPLAVILWVGPGPLLSPAPFAPDVSEVRTLAWTSEYERIIAQFYHEFRCRIFRYGLFFPVHSCCVLLSSNQNQSGEANRAHAEINAGV